MYPPQQMAKRQKDFSRTQYSEYHPRGHILIHEKTSPSPFKNVLFLVIEMNDPGRFGKKEHYSFPFLQPTCTS